MECRVSTLERAFEENREETRANFQRFGDMIEDILRRLKNMERESVESKGSVYGDRVGRSEEVEEEWEEDKRESERGWMKRVELPSFEGRDPIGWISRAEKFFEVQEVSPRERIKLAFISMEGGANHWFSFWRKKTKTPTWEELKEALMRRFGGRDRSSYMKNWLLSNSKEKWKIKYRNLRC